MKNKGITLIALVVTIVVLLILAGITISLVFGSNGVIQKAQDSKEQTEIGEMREKLEMAKVPVYADGNGLYKVQDYWDRIESEGLIADKTVDIIDNGDGTYEVTTTPGYVFEITVEPNKEIAENIIIGECIGKGENLSIGIRVVKKTTNSIEIEVVRAEGASNFKYSIKKQGEEYGAAEEKSETRHVFSGLTQGGIYTIKVEATKDGEQQTVEKTVQVGEIPLAIDGDVIWTGNGQASVRIYTEEEGYQIEWQKNGISEGSWTREASGVKEKTITGLVNGDIIYARLYDGVSSGKYANIEVMDKIAPEITKFEIVEVTQSSVFVKVEANDFESGLATTGAYKYYLENELKEISNNINYNYINLNTKHTYNLTVEVVDNVGNKARKVQKVTTLGEQLADDVLLEGKYVNYEDGTGVTRKCAVLYDSKSEYGLQIITLDTVENVTLGDRENVSQYNNAVNDLNKITEKYINFKYVKDSRCVGSNPIDKNIQGNYYTVDSTKYNFNGQLREADENYLYDFNKMKELDICELDNDRLNGREYWLASRYILDISNMGSAYGYLTHDLYAINNSGYLDNNALRGILNVHKKGYMGIEGSIESFGLRPVFILKENIKIVKGSGSKVDPYVLGI